MQKVIHIENVKSAIQSLGWSQKELAAQLGVTGQAVTNWMKGVDFPRPDKLLKLATTLKLGFGELVMVPKESAPVIAFRKKGGAKTTDEHITKALAMGALLILPLTTWRCRPSRRRCARIWAWAKARYCTTSSC